MFKYLIAFSLLIASVNFANAQVSDNICNTDFEEVHRTLTEKYKERYIFAGITISGSPLHFYLGKNTWTVIVQTVNGEYCTGPQYSGQTIMDNTRLPDVRS